MLVFIIPPIFSFRFFLCWSQNNLATPLIEIPQDLSCSSVKNVLLCLSHPWEPVFASWVHLLSLSCWALFHPMVQTGIFEAASSKLGTILRSALFHSYSFLRWPPHPREPLSTFWSGNFSRFPWQDSSPLWFVTTMLRAHTFVGSQTFVQTFH